MSRYILIHRLRGPAFLLLVGVNALLAQKGILGWSQSWPFYLILAGLLRLAEGAALASEGYPPYPWGTGPGVNPAANPGATPGAPIQGFGQGTGQAASTSLSVVPQTGWQEFDNKKDGGQ